MGIQAVGAQVKEDEPLTWAPWTTGCGALLPPSGHWRARQGRELEDSCWAHPTSIPLTLQPSCSGRKVVCRDSSDLSVLVSLGGHTNQN